MKLICLAYFTYLQIRWNYIKIRTQWQTRRREKSRIMTAFQPTCLYLVIILQELTLKMTVFKHESRISRWSEIDERWQKQQNCPNGYLAGNCLIIANRLLSVFIIQLEILRDRERLYCCKYFVLIWGEIFRSRQ